LLVEAADVAMAFATFQNHFEIPIQGQGCLLWLSYPVPTLKEIVAVPYQKLIIRDKLINRVAKKFDSDCERVS
jgi:heme exporter protein D